MLPGTLAGQYDFDEMAIPLKPLAEACDAELIIEPAVALRSQEREVILQSGRTVAFDVASVGIGSVPSHRDMWDGVPGVVPVKPMQTFLSRVDAAVAEAQAARERTSERLPLSVAVVGGGAAGVEIALCLQKRLEDNKLAASILLIDARERILAGYRRSTVKLAEREFIRRGILSRMGETVTAVRRFQQTEREGVELELSGGDQIVPNMVVWTTGAAPPPALHNFDLPKADAGFLAVRRTLQSTADVPVFAVGDTADFVKNNVPKAGVYAVRQGPVLWKNLKRHLSGQPLAEFSPQRGFLSLLNTGDGRAILQYKVCTSHSRWAWRLKDRLDRGFVRKHRTRTAGS